MFRQFSTDIAAFVRTIQTSKTKASRIKQLSSSALRGKDLFEGKAGCATCHRGDDFTDGQFHNTGLPMHHPFTTDNLPDLGRAFGVGAYLSTQPIPSQLCENSTSKACREAPYLSAFATEPVGAFKTPSLWNVSRTAPYMHDGSLASLDDVLAFYNQLPTRAAVGRRTGVMRSLGFSPDELADLKSYLESLVSPVTYNDGVNQHEIM